MQTIEAKALDKAKGEVTDSIRQTDIERLSKLANAVGKGWGENPDPYSFIRNVTLTATKEVGLRAGCGDLRKLAWSGGRESSQKNFLNSHQNSHLTKTKKATSRVALANY